jgi:hypothetical protein
LDSFGRFFSDKDSGPNLKRTDADGKGPNSKQRVIFPGYSLRHAEEKKSSGEKQKCHTASFWKFLEASVLKRQEWRTFGVKVKH